MSGTGTADRTTEEGQGDLRRSLGFRDLRCCARPPSRWSVWAARRDDGMDHLVSVVGIGALTAFTLLHASVGGWFAVRRLGGPVIWWRHVLVPVAGAVITVAVIVEASEAGQVVGAVWLVVGVSVLVGQRRRPDHAAR